MNRALKSLKTFAFWFFLCKVYNAWPKKVLRSIFHGTKESCKIWRKNDLRFGKWHEEFGKFSSEHLKMLKLVFSWDPFAQSRKYIKQSNNTEEWEKILGGIDLPFQNWQKEFDEFWLKNSKVSKIYTLMGRFWPNYTIFGLKNYRGVMFDCTPDWYKVWRKTGLCFHKLTWGIW